jgi:putative ABC transport system permease protein
MTQSPDHQATRSPAGSMFWRLWWRAITVQRSQAALALGSLVVGAAITSMLLNLYGDVRRKMTEDFRSYGPNVVIAPPSTATGTDDVEGSRTLEESALLPLSQFGRETPGMSFVPVLYAVVRVSRDTADPRLSEFTNVVAAGAEFGMLRTLNPGWRETGENISADLPPGYCAVGSNFAAQMHVRLGDSLQVEQLASVPERSQDQQLGRHTPPERGAANDPASLSPLVRYRIATIVETGASEDDQVFLPIAALQSLLEMPGKVTLVEVRIPGGSREVKNAVQRLAGLLSTLDVRAIRQIVYSEGKVLETTRWLLLSLTVLIIGTIALCVMATMTAIILERRRDIGVMKALGAADGLLTRLFLAESATLGLLGGAIGYGAGAVLANGVAERLFGVKLSLSAWIPLMVCGFTVALAVIAAQTPMRIVREIQPTVVLKGE